LFGATADQLLPIVLIVLALDASGLAPATALSLVFAARFGGLALFIILGGVLADRVDRYRFMALINLLRIATVGALFLTPAPTPMAVLALAAFVMASLEGMFSPCYTA
jgi:MFS family permease